MPEGKNVKGVLIFVCWCRNIFEVQLLVKLVELTRSILLPLEDPLGFTQMVFMISYIVSKNLLRFPSTSKLTASRSSYVDGHMLQLRQCKLAFPSVHLLVGCCSSELVHKHKAQPVMHSEERYESLRHVKWVDEVVEDAPWTVDQEFIDKWEIDYVAHDEEPYVSAGSDDVYAFAKSIGKH